MKHLIYFLFALQLGATDQFWIQCGSLIDGQSDKVIHQVTIRTEGDRIVDIIPGYVQGKSGQTIDLRSATVMPGLIDMHVHLSMEMSPQSYTERFFFEQAEIAFRSVQAAEKTLMAGFTTVRNLGDRDNISISMRKSIERGWIIGPRIFSAGKSIATTGGHADPTNGLKSDLKGDPGPIDGVVNSIEDGRKAVRQRYKDGADLIKITATGGVLSMAKSGMNPQFLPEELDSIVQTAHDYGFKVAAHAHGTEGMKRAVLAGVDSIEHGTYLTDEVLTLMKERGTWLVPTILAGATVAELAEIDGYFPEIVRPKAATIGPIMLGSFSKAYQSGVNIAFGTDSGVSRHGDNWKEFELMVSGGMSQMEAIQSATKKAAELLGQESLLGTIETGKLADIVAVANNPLEDIRAMNHVIFVMKAGKVFKQDP